MKALGIEPLESTTLVKVAGYIHPYFMSPLHSHYNEVDLLGIDFMKNFRVSILPDWDAAKFKFAFGWKFVEDPTDSSVTY